MLLNPQCWSQERDWEKNPPQTERKTNQEDSYRVLSVNLGWGPLPVLTHDKVHRKIAGQRSPKPGMLRSGIKEG